MAGMDWNEFDEYVKSLEELNASLESLTTSMLEFRVQLNETRRTVEQGDPEQSKEFLSKFVTLTKLLEKHQVILGRYGRELTSYRNDAAYMAEL